MSTLPSHAVMSMGLAPLVLGRGVKGWILALGAGVAMLPDLDVIAFRFGIPYGHPLGHRGFSHSLLLAALAGLITYGLARWRRFHASERLSLFIFLAMASHGVLDAMTSGGRGVGFFIPFSDARYFFPWRPIRVSPFGMTWLFSARGLAVMLSELQWVWLPALGFALMGWMLHRSFRHDPEPARLP
ncbi:MAG: metal-dependent hydrolase [Firmicutes bacterium]|nr:metal-dependent hydrolase [Bacillota bacterium]